MKRLHIIEIVMIYNFKVLTSRSATKNIMQKSAKQQRNERFTRRIDVVKIVNKSQMLETLNRSAQRRVIPRTNNSFTECEYSIQARKLDTVRITTILCSSQLLYKSSQ